MPVLWTDADIYFNFAAHMLWRENKPILAAQIQKMWTDDEELVLPRGMFWTKWHQLWFLEHPEWLISAWAAAGVQVTRTAKYNIGCQAASFLGNELERS